MALRMEGRASSTLMEEERGQKGQKHVERGYAAQRRNQIDGKVGSKQTGKVDRPLAA